MTVAAEVTDGTVVGGADRRDVSVAMQVDSQAARARFMEVVATADDRAATRHRGGDPGAKVTHNTVTGD